ncbi:SRPBCC family protein [Gillisia marina]|uniref:SRPBCC family protein n=1 Tax=Gillisia marina TaxID=1167637 RepID=UPI00029AAB4F|nr:GyrI-like domain-containing protein [Gillisia marina]
MKILKYLFFLLLVIIIAGAIYVATKDGNYQVEETAIIHAPVPVVFNEVNNFKNWDKWGPWMDDADDIIINYPENTIGENASFSWKSEKMGDGSIKNIKVIPESAIDQKLSFKSPYGESNSNVYWDFLEVEEGTKVTWGIKGEQSFMEKLAFTFMEKSFPEMIRPMYKEGLEKLNTVVLEKMSTYSINVDGITTHGGGFYMYTTTATKISQIQTKMQKMFADVSLYMEQNNISTMGNPFVLYNKWDEQNNSAIYSTGYFTPSLIITPAESTVLNGMMPVQKVIKTTLKGDYKNLKEAWDATYKYAQENNLPVNPDSPAFEVYAIRPDKSPNPANWVTEIYIPLLEVEEPTL